MGHVYLHRLRAETALGKSLPKGAHVHHADLSKSDDAPLVICQDNAFHALLHIRTRIVKAGGNPNTQRICSACKVLKLIEEMGKRKPTPRGLYSQGVHNVCKACTSKHVNARYHFLNPAARIKQPPRTYHCLECAAPFQRRTDAKQPPRFCSISCVATKNRRIAADRKSANAA